MSSFRLRQISRAALSGGGVAWLAAMLAACNPTPLDRTASESPDALDRIRAADLLPRFPSPASTTQGTGSGSRGGVVSYGEIVPVVSARNDGGGPAGAGGNGDGFSLNFENAPVTTIAKVILGDILGAGYTIDPRAQGTVSLSSGRPVPKKDMLLALESALRTSNLVLVKDPAGYRIVPQPKRPAPAASTTPTSGRPNRATASRSFRFNMFRCRRSPNCSKASPPSPA